MSLIDASGRSHRDAPVLRFDPTREEFAELLHGEPRYRLDQAWTGLHERGDKIDNLTNLPKALRQRIDEELPLGLTPEEESVSDDGETVKWLWRLHDGHQIETVLMHYDDRTTVCVSSQAGCAMACSFCATGQSGFDRHLSVGEIVEQVVRAR
ncbi:MAG: 23S rRNA (adenine(2503)-C(2))-methyltransferase RlmN, partial [Acidimicrobiaceae bacterium]|nr:23S rRNA (adenine(2503)-C(2))-methyltransferase RlmN [Acidimicrobiaceae bacterium]